MTAARDYRRRVEELSDLIVSAFRVGEFISEARIFFREQHSDGVHCCAVGALATQANPRGWDNAQPDPYYEDVIGYTTGYAAGQRAYRLVTKGAA